jgi:hypothetical protein
MVLSSIAALAFAACSSNPAPSVERAVDSGSSELTAKGSPLFGPHDDVANAVTIQNGKILAVGYSTKNFIPTEGFMKAVAMARYNP